MVDSWDLAHHVYRACLLVANRLGEDLVGQGRRLIEEVVALR